MGNLKHVGSIYSFSFRLQSYVSFEQNSIEIIQQQLNTKLYQIKLVLNTDWANIMPPKA